MLPEPMGITIIIKQLAFGQPSSAFSQTTCRSVQCEHALNSRAASSDNSSIHHVDHFPATARQSPASCIVATNQFSASELEQSTSQNITTSLWTSPGCGLPLSLCERAKDAKNIRSSRLIGCLTAQPRTRSGSWDPLGCRRWRPLHRHASRRHSASEMTVSALS
jgi:hypothetical protein